MVRTLYFRWWEPRLSRGVTIGFAVIVFSIIYKDLEMFVAFGSRRVRLEAMPVS